MDDENQITYVESERRSESRTRVDEYTIVEFSVNGLELSYKFKIWDLSPSGIGVLVKEGSEILNHLNVGDILNMKYYRQQSSGQPEQLRTEIKHINRDTQGRFRGNYLIGLSILGNRNGTD